MNSFFKSVISMLFLLFFVPVTLPAQSEDEPEVVRRWAFDGQLGPISTLKLATSGLGVAGSNFGLGSNSTGLGTRLRAEYFVPATHFSVKAGYDHEQLNFLGSDVASDLSQLTLGGRWYAAPQWWVFQPYAGLDALVNLNSRSERFGMTARSVSGSMDYDRAGVVRLPRVSMAPVVGADLWMFSSIALQVEYGFRLGIDSRVDVDSQYAKDSRIYHSHGHIHRHAFSLGLKISFPFTFTEDDGVTFLEGLFGLF